MRLNVDNLWISIYLHFSRISGQYHGYPRNIFRISKSRPCKILRISCDVPGISQFINGMSCRYPLITHGPVKLNYTHYRMALLDIYGYSLGNRLVLYLCMYFHVHVLLQDKRENY